MLAFKNEHTVNEKNLKVIRRQLKDFVSRINNNADKKKEIMDKLKEEALLVNTLLGKCETVNILKYYTHRFTHIHKSFYKKIIKFDDQVDQLVKHLEINEEQLKHREIICQSLNNIFRQFWNENGKEKNISRSPHGRFAPVPKVIKSKSSQVNI